MRSSYLLVAKEEIGKISLGVGSFHGENLDVVSGVVGSKACAPISVSSQQSLYKHPAQ